MDRVVDVAKAAHVDGEALVADGAKDAGVVNTYNGHIDYART